MPTRAEGRGLKWVSTTSFKHLEWWMEMDLVWFVSDLEGNLEGQDKVLARGGGKRLRSLKIFGATLNSQCQSAIKSLNICWYFNSTSCNNNNASCQTFLLKKPFPAGRLPLVIRPSRLCDRWRGALLARPWLAVWCRAWGNDKQHGRYL